MLKLPGNPLDFIVWWAKKSPIKIFIVCKRITSLLNNRLSFLVNLKLIFTPIFGDYSIMGRVTGFVFRLFEIIFGFIFISTLSIVTLILPLIWYILPFYTIEYTKWFSVLIFIGVYLVWAISTKDTPLKKVKNVAESNPLPAFRTEALLMLKGLKINAKQEIAKIINHEKIYSILNKAELSQKEFGQKIIEAPSFDASQIEKTCYKYAVKQGTRYIEPEQVFLAFVSLISKVDIVLSTFNTNLKYIEETVSWILKERESLSKLYIWQDDYINLFSGGTGKGMTGRITPKLDSISLDYTKMVKKGHIKKIIGRTNEIKKIAEILNGEKENILIIGEPGSGKTSIVKGIAYEIIMGTEYRALKNKRIVSIDLGGLLSGAKNSGEIAEKLTHVMEEVRGSKDIILFIDEIHNLVINPEIFSILESHLASSEIQFIGATNIANFRKHIEPNGSFARLFQLVELKQATKEDTILILQDVCSTLEKKHKILITYPALVKTVELSEKLIHERVLPDKAIDILSRAASAVENTNKPLNSATIAKEVSEMTNVPVESVDQNEAKKLLDLHNQLKKMVIGQDNAIDQISDALKRARVGIRNENKPIASFLFIGTTGVGKTQTAKALAQEYFGDKKAMIRLDMSEYQQVDSINRLLGAPGGFVKGILTENVRTHPFSLILLDEIEKAHPNILLTFLQVLDDGRLTDSSGQVIDFTNTIIIATSNVGTRAIQEISQKGGSIDEMNASAMQEVRNKYAPEFLNRFNGLVVFKPLNTESINKIALLLLEDVRKMAENKGIKITFKPELVSEIAKRGFSPEWGARPLARVIEDNVESYLATQVLENKIKSGDELNLGLECLKNI